METDDSWARDVAPTFLVNRTDGKISDLTAAEMVRRRQVMM